MSQDILSFGLDLSGFTPEQKKLLQEFVNYFELLSRYDGKIIKPILGEGLVAFNNSIKQSAALVEELNLKLSKLGAGKPGAAAAQSMTELGLAMGEFKKEGDQAAITSAKISVSTSEQAKETMSLKLQLSDVRKQLLDNIRAQQEATKAKELDIIRSKEYELEQQRVVGVLRNLAREQDLAAKKQVSDTKKTSKAAEIEETKRLRIQEDLYNNSLKQKENSEKIASTSRKVAMAELNNLTTDYEKLSIALQEQAAIYRELYMSKGAKAPETIVAAQNYQATVGIIDDIDKGLKKTNSSANMVGHSLKGMYNNLRILAYALPGIGIAGLFNVAYQAIMQCVDALHLFDTSEEKIAAKTKNINDLIREQLDLFKNLVEKATDLDNLDFNNLENLNKGIDRMKVRGEGQDVAAGLDVGVAKDKFLAAQKEASFAFGFKTFPQSAEEIARGGQWQIEAGKQINTVLDERKKALDVATKKLSEINGLQTKIKNMILIPIGDRRPDQNEFLSKEGIHGIMHVDASLERLDKLKESAKSEVDIENKKLELLKGYAKDYNDTLEGLRDKDAANSKSKVDEELKFQQETLKSRLSVETTNQEIILKKEISSQKQRVEAITELSRIKTRENTLERDRVTTSLTSTVRDKDIANAKFADEELKNESDRKVKILELNESYRQRLLTAVASINKAEVEQEALKNERIYKDDTKSIEERLNAYGIYVKKRQTQNDIEYVRAIDTLALKSKGKVPAKEVAALGAQRDEQKFAAQADAERQAYEIVYATLQKELKIVVDINQAEIQNEQIKYTAELKLLNDNLENRKISYGKWLRERNKLDRQYRIKIIQDDILDDRTDMVRLKEQLDEEQSLKDRADKKVVTAKDNLEFQKKTGTPDDILAAQFDYSTAVGESEAADKAIFDSKVEYAKKEKKLNDDLLKEQLLRIEMEAKARQKKFDLDKQIIDALYQLAKTAIDGEYERRLKNLEKNKQIVDEQYGNEIAAVEKSSLTAKDKAALDVQLNAEKQAFDKANAIEARKLKHDQAVADRSLAVVHIVWSTEEAIAKIYAEFAGNPIAATGLAIRQGILGAIQVATVLAAPIPSFAAGGVLKKGEIVRYGEAGKEVVKEPYKSPYLITKETISYLPKGTEIIPVMDTPEFGGSMPKDEGWEQVRWLAKQMKKGKQDVKINNTINVDLGFQMYKHRILNG